MRPAASEDFTGLILAGGASSRMGFNKVTARLGKDTLLGRTVRLLDTLCGRVLVVAPDLDPSLAPEARLVRGEPPRAGPLGALAAGLQACHTPYALVLACDLPLFPHPLARYMQERCREEPGWQALVPRWGQYWEPLAAIYARSCLPSVLAALGRGERRLTAFYPHITIRPVTEEEIRRFAPPERAFFNVNRPSDLVQAALMLGVAEGPVLSRAVPSPAGEPSPPGSNGFLCSRQE